MFIPESIFRPYQDLNGKAAAEYLASQGYTGIAYADLGTNGLAVGLDSEGGLVALSTNGAFNSLAHDSNSYRRFLQANPTMLED